jgi:two-component system, response regulator YesN
MYKFLLVDDDVIIREGIRDNIPWERLGFSFIGDYEDGNQAIEAINKYKPDVILTDICMPFMDGLELANYIAESFPSTKIIVITGYDKFDYAQKAIKLNVYDFILKPITPDELIKILEKAKSDLDKERASKRNIINLRKKLSESYFVMKDRFLNKIIYGKLDPDEMRNPAKYIDLKFPFYSVIVVDIDDSSELKSKIGEQKFESLSSNIFNYCMHSVENLDMDGHVFFNKDECIVILFNEASCDVLDKKKFSAAEDIRHTVEEMTDTTVTIGVGTNCCSLRGIPGSFQNAVTAINYRFLLGSNRMINYDDLLKNHAIDMIFKKEWDKEIILSLKTGGVDETKGLVHEMIGNLKKNMIPIEKSYAYIQRIIALIYSIINEFEIDERKIFEENKNPFLHIYDFKTLDKLELWLVETIGNVHMRIIEKRDDFNKDKITMAENYIKENYSNEEMTLSSICFYLCMSKSRFSPLFKKYTGMTFIEYLTRIRIEKSMELLKTTSLMAYEIAGKVGFSDPHYFSLIFKKITNMSPSEFRTNFEYNAAV